jgi:micrococcal nuclease
MARRRRGGVNGGRRWDKPDAYRPAPSKGSGKDWGRYSWLWLGAIFIGLIVGLGPNWLDRDGGSGEGQPQALLAASGGVRAHFGFCHTGGGTNCVVDGDTIWLQGQNIRVADIDAPETHE